MHDYTKADLDPQTRGMLDYTAKLTREPESMREADVIKLRDLGLTDEQILSTALIAAMYAFMTRLADGLGVDVQQDRIEFIERWLTGPAREQEWLMKGHN